MLNSQASYLVHIALYPDISFFIYYTHLHGLHLAQIALLALYSLDMLLSIHTLSIILRVGKIETTKP